MNAQEQPVPPVDQAALDQLLNQPREESKFDEEGREHIGLGQINEAIQEDISEATEIQRVNGDAIAYAPEQQAIGTQLEMMSQISGGANSVMNTSPIRSTRGARAARTKGKIDR